MKLTIKQKRFADEYIISGNAYGIVYKITNLINGKCYIGITTRTLKQRFVEHCKADSGIGKAIRKYGVDNFYKQVIDTADNYEELMYLEVEYIKIYNSYKSGYNQTLGGDGVIFHEDLNIALTDGQKKYLKFVEMENKKTLNVNDSSQMIRMCLMNLINIYLIATKIKDKIAISKLILRLKSPFLKSVLSTNILSLEEIKHYARQKISSFEVFSNG